MHAHIVVAHPNPASLTHAVTARLAEAIHASGQSAAIADLAAEGFDPRFTRADLDVHHRVSRPSADVLAEQARLDGADALVLVFPVYWWSMPGLLKGWIDRVFANGWAFDFSPEGGTEKKLGHLRVHLVGLAGADERSYERHGYGTAMHAQIDHGIFEYCGATVVTSTLLYDSELTDPAGLLERVEVIGRAVFAENR